MQESTEQRITEATEAARESLELILAKGLNQGFDPLTTSAGKSAQALVDICRAVWILEERVRALEGAGIPLPRQSPTLVIRYLGPGAFGAADPLRQLPELHLDAGDGRTTHHREHVFNCPDMREPDLEEVLYMAESLAREIRLEVTR